MTATPGLEFGAAGPRVATLREQVAEALRTALVTGQMEAGVVYPAPLLAEKLGVSATPVREAMLDLVREGMVEVVRNTGFRVTTLTDEDHADLVELRLLIEPPTMALVAESCEGVVAESVTGLTPLAHRMIDAVRAADLVTFAQLDNEFHTTFLALHGNPKIVNEVRKLRNQCRLYSAQTLSAAGQLAIAADEHVQMIAQALARDRVGIEATVYTHIARLRGE